MNRVFADSFYFFALGNPRDPAHPRARAFIQSFAGQLVTTGWIVTELGDGRTLPSQRPLFVRLAEQLRTDPDVRFIPRTDELMVAGFQRFGQRPDKDRSPRSDRDVSPGSGWRTRRRFLAITAASLRRTCLTWRDGPRLILKGSCWDV